MILSHIVAVSDNFVIGRQNRLPWSIPEDARYFHRVTEGHIIIMGRKNYQANGKALPRRTNIVITRDTAFKANDAIIVPGISEAISVAETYSPEEVFIVGGGEIYHQTLDMVQRIYITYIHTLVEGDTTYPKILPNEYTILSKITKQADVENPIPRTYYILEKPV